MLSVLSSKTLTGCLSSLISDDVTTRSNPMRSHHTTARKQAMKTCLYLTSAMLLLVTPALAKDKLTPEQRFIEAKKLCPERATTKEGWDRIRACIELAKANIIMGEEPSIRAKCGTYEGADRSNCVDWVYMHGYSTWTPAFHAEREQLRKRQLDNPQPLPPADPNLLRQGKAHEATEREN